MAPPLAFAWRPGGGPQRRVEFLSDLHLSPTTPRTQQALAQHLRGTRADAVCILGDLFEVWVGDDARHDVWESSLVALLREASQRCHLAFMAGNRDFLVGPALAADCGMTLLPDPSVLELDGQRILLSHGDALCLDDRPYQAFRAQVRHAAWQQQFLAQPLAERRRQALQMRAMSQERRRFDGAEGSDLDEAACLQWLSAAHADLLVHGHTHKPAEHLLAAGSPAERRRCVLSDWDFDAPSAARGDLLVWEAGRLQRQAVPAPAAA